MNTTEQTKRYAKWKALIEEQKQSGKSRKAFCEERGLVLSQFVYYRAVLKERLASIPTTPLSVTPIKIKNVYEQVRHPEIKLVLPNGFQCMISSETEVSYIKRLLEVLLSC